MSDINRQLSYVYNLTYLCIISFSGRLKIRVIPTIGLVTENKTKDFIVGFTELGNRDDFSTEMLEWRIAR